MDKQWKIGLVGCSRGSAYGNLAHRHPRFDIVALCDRDERMLAHYQKELEFPDSRCFTSYDGFLNATPKLDAVVVGTPIPAHAEQAAKALDAGLHVMSEVTAANTVEGCAAIVQAARRRVCRTRRGRRRC